MTAQAIDPALERRDDWREKSPLTFEDPRHVDAQRLNQGHQNQQVQADLHQVGAGHWNRSG